MKRRLAIASLLFAWLCANGAVLDALQVVAWGKMFAGYTSTMSVSQALRETLDASKPCELCGEIAKVKATTGKARPAAAHEAAAKFVIALETEDAPAFVGERPRWAPATSRFVATWSESVPVPPPRA